MLITLESTLVNRKCVRGLGFNAYFETQLNKRAKKMCQRNSFSH